MPNLFIIFQKTVLGGGFINSEARVLLLTSTAVVRFAVGHYVRISHFLIKLCSSFILQLILLKIFVDCELM